MLSSRFKECSGDVDIVNFEWSGLNSHEARIDAALRLREVINEISMQSPEGDIFVVSHSHGGNVALYAIKCLPAHVVAHIKLVTMGTPFITCRPRRVEMGVTLAATSLTVWAIVLLLFLTVPVHQVYGQNGLGIYLVACALSFCFFLYHWAVGGTRDICARIVERLQDEQPKFVKLIHASPTVCPPILCCISPFDEALLHLRLLRSLSTIPMHLMAAFGLVYESIWHDADNLNGISDVHLFLGPAKFISIGAVVAPLLLLGIGITSVVRSHRYGFGAESVMLNLVIDVRPTRLPRVAAAVEVVAATGPVARLRHSRFFGDPKIADKIVVWCKSNEVGEPDHLRCQDLPSKIPAVIATVLSHAFIVSPILAAFIYGISKSRN